MRLRLWCNHTPPDIFVSDIAMTAATPTRADAPTPTVLDAVVIGAGFADPYAVHNLRDKWGLRVRAYETGADVRGTWYWNRYPGARCDIQSYHYSYSFSKTLQQEWRWSEHFAAQPEILAYLNHVADRFDLRKDIALETRIESAQYDEVAGQWVIGTSAGDTVRATYLVSGAGCLSAPHLPDFKGINSFAGQIYMTSKWPDKEVDFSGLRVGIVGTGASGIQAIPVIAEHARQLTVFQRTPNYAVPIRNRPLDDISDAEIKAQYDVIRSKSRHSFIGLPQDNTQPSAKAVDEQERQRVYEAAYAEGGLAMFHTFSDLLLDAESNETAAEFVRTKIRERVNDPEVAELLVPKGYPWGTKRPPLETNYYEAFNRPNVKLVDVKSAPIEEITATGIRTTDAHHDLDVIIFATGFDAITGPLLRLNPRGKNGVTLADRWGDGPRTYLGLMVSGFPNFFTITGPQSPSVLYNMPLAVEDHVDWISDCIRHMRDQGQRSVEPTAEAEADWVKLNAAIADQTLFNQTASWYTGGNIPGKPRVFQLFIGGAAHYREICAQIVAEGYKGFVFSAA